MVVVSVLFTVKSSLDIYIEVRELKSRASVVCIGELLIDFFCTDIEVDLLEGKHFEKQAGGAPANVCATIVKLGGNATLSGKVGNDPFGHFLKSTLNEVMVDTSMLVLDDHHPTTIAFVSLKKNGERDFVFNRGADAYLTEDELEQGKLREARILHFGSATALLEGEFLSTYLNTMKSAKEGGQFISFDPNYRSNLWDGYEDRFIDRVKEAAGFAHFMKVSDEELTIITGENDLANGVQKLHKLGVELVAVTLGKDGTLISNRVNQDVIPSLEIDSIDSTGAGDAFVGAMLYQLAEEEPHKTIEDFERIKKITTLSNKVGALVCTKLGAISAIPEPEEVFKISQ